MTKLICVLALLLMMVACFGPVSQAVRSAHQSKVTVNTIIDEAARQ